MKCRKCEAEMYLDDAIINDKNDRCEYWNCTNCNSSCIKTIICGIPICEKFVLRETNYDVKDYVVYMLCGGE